MSKFLEDIKAYINEKHYNVYTVAEIKDGKEAESISLLNTNECQNSYSVCKVFVVTAIGVLCDRGLLTVNSKVVDLLGEDFPKGIDKRWNEVTVHMLLTHSAGLPGGCLDIDCIDCRQYGDDYLDALFRLPLQYAPGTDRAYSDGAFYLLSFIAEKLSGENLLTFLWKEVLFKLNVREAAWSCCPKGHCIGGSGLYIRSSDMVKLGEVYLEGGSFNGQRIISEEWVRRVLAAPYELAPKGIGNIYGKGGMHCQQLFVDPDKKRAVAFHSYDDVDCDDLIRFTAEYED